MKLTALEIKQQKFEKSLRGYDPAEVEAFLDLVSNEWEHLVAKNRELESKVESLEEKLEHYKKVEEALHETLQTAKESAEHKLDGARKEARNKVERAEMEAESILRDAYSRRQEIRQNILRLLDRRKEIIGGIRSYLELAEESIDHFSKDDAELYRMPPLDPSASSGRSGETGSEPSGTSREHSGKGNGGGESPSGARPDNRKKEDPSPPGAGELDDIIDELD